jgi:hypothetical protein
MNILITTYIICGVSLAVEYVRGDEEHTGTVVIDLLMLRIMIHIGE